MSETVVFCCKRCGSANVARPEKGIKVSDNRVVLECAVCGSSNVLKEPKREPVGAR